MKEKRFEEMNFLLEHIRLSGSDPYQALINYAPKSSKKYFNYMKEVKRVVVKGIVPRNYSNEAFYFLGSRIVPFSKDKYIKLYVPLDGDHIVEGSQKLFDFIEKEKIVHESKISTVMGTDDIVVRTPTLEGAKKICEFVEGEAIIQEGMIRKNPFLVEYGSIGVAMDGYVSFNDELSYYIDEYIKDVKKNACWTSVNDFKHYLINFRNNLFKDESFFSEYMDRRVFRFKNNISSELMSRLEVCDIIINNLSTGYSLDECYHDIVDSTKRGVRQQKVKELLNGIR